MNRILIAVLALGVGLFAVDQAQAQRHGHGHGHGHHARHGGHHHHGSFGISIGNFGYSQWGGHHGAVRVGYPNYYSPRVYRAPVYYPSYPVYGGYYGGGYGRPSCGRGGGGIYIGW